jgi:hypothetical protein
MGSGSRLRGRSGGSAIHVDDDAPAHLPSEDRASGVECLGEPDLVRNRFKRLAVDLCGKVLPLPTRRSVGHVTESMPTSRILRRMKARPWPELIPCARPHAATTPLAESARRRWQAMFLTESMRLRNAPSQACRRAPKVPPDDDLGGAERLQVIGLAAAGAREDAR